MRKPKAERGGVASRNHTVQLMRELRFELKDHTIMCDTMANWWFQFKVYTIARAIYTYFGSEFGLIHVSSNLFWMSIFRYKCTHTLKNRVIYILISAYTLVFVQNIKNLIFTNKENPRRKGSISIEIWIMPDSFYEYNTNGKLSMKEICLFLVCIPNCWALLWCQQLLGLTARYSQFTPLIALLIESRHYYDTVKNHLGKKRRTILSVKWLLKHPQILNIWFWRIDYFCSRLS